MPDTSKTHKGHISRRNLLKGLGIGAVGAGIGLGFTPQLAKAQTSVSSANISAFYRFNVGDFELTVINDGTVVFPPINFAVNAEESDVNDLLQQHNLPTDAVNLPIGVVLVKIGERLILLDSGDGGSGMISDNTGKLLPTLELLGTPADTITDVIFSHYHPDHLGAASFDGNTAFPNAQYYLPQVEWDFMEGSDIPEAVAPFVDFAKNKLQPIVDNTGQLSFFGDEDEVVSGIQALFTPGHSPGHHSFMLESNGDQLLYTADAITHPVLSLQNPGWYMGFDQLPDIAVESRLALLNRVADEQIPVVGYHFAFPGIGYVGRNETGFRFTPTM